MNPLDRFDKAAGPLGILLGAGVGFALARVPGALLGALLGHLFQKQLAPGGSRGAAAKAVERAAALVRLAVAVARVDGPVDEREREAIRSYFHRDAGLPADHLPGIDHMITGAEQGEREDPGAAARGLPSLDPADRVHVLFVLFRVALADRVLTPDEDAALREVAHVVGLAAADHAGVRGHFVVDGEPGGGDDYRTLGVEPGTDLETVRARYKEAVRSYHPDRFQHLGEEFTSVATARFKRIQEAWQRVSEGTPTRAKQRLSVCGACRVFSGVEQRVCPSCGQAKHVEDGDRVRLRCPFCIQTNAFPRPALCGSVRCGNCKVLLVR